MKTENTKDTAPVAPIAQETPKEVETTTSPNQQDSLSSLPKLSEDLTYNITIDGIDIVFRSWKTKDEKHYLIAKDRLLQQKTKSPKANKLDDTDEFTLIYKYIIVPCVISGDIEKLSMAGLKRFILELRVTSNSEILEDLNVKCSACNRTVQVDLDISNDVKYVDCSRTPQRITEDLQIQFNTLSFNEVLKLDKDTTNTDPLFLKCIHKSIKVIIYKDKIYDTFSEKEVINFIDELPSSVFKKLIESYEKSAGLLEIKKSITCPYCSGTQEVDLAKESNFF